MVLADRPVMAATLLALLASTFGWIDATRHRQFPTEPIPHVTHGIEQLAFELTLDQTLIRRLVVRSEATPAFGSEKPAGRGRGRQSIDALLTTDSSQDR